MEFSPRGALNWAAESREAETKRGPRSSTANATLNTQFSERQRPVNCCRTIAKVFSATTKAKYQIMAE